MVYGWPAFVGSPSRTAYCEHEHTTQTDVRESQRTPPVKRNLRLQLNFRAKPYTSCPLVSISERRGRGWVHEDFAAAHHKCCAATLRRCGRRSRGEVCP